MATEAHELTRRSLLRLALATPVAAGLLAVPTISTVAKPHPVRPRSWRLRLGRDKLRRLDRQQHLNDAPETAEASEADVYTSDEVHTEPFRVTGLTWSGDHPTVATLLIRTRNRGRGTWSEWTELHDDGHGPDPDSAEATGARRGTDAVVVDEADAIEVRVDAPDGIVPPDLRVELIEPGESDADATVGAAIAGAAQAAPHRPTIRTRADWGADESMRGNAEYAEVRGMFVHHTAGSNSYSSSDVPGIIRGIYAYHVNGRGWRDIGYNFLIDKFGGIWEGRYGGIDRAVIGAHTLGYNTYAFAASVLGTYVNNKPSAATLRAYERLIAWKFGIHGVNASSKVAYPGRKTLPAISGHRDGGATECPGDRLYAKLGTIRDAASDPLSSKLRFAAHTTTARADKRIFFDIEWRAGSTPVNGRVQLQRRTSSGWANVRKARIRNGVGAVRANPPADRTYRLISVESTNPANVSKVRAGTLSIAVEQSRSNLTMIRAGATRPDGEVPIDIDWRYGSSGVTGRVELQYFRNGTWRRAREAKVTNGTGTTVLRPSRTQTYRLRALRTDRPSSAPTRHPVGTSNEFRVRA